MKKAKEEIVKTTVRMPKSLWSKVRIAAIERETSAEALVVEAMIQFLKGGK